MKLNRIVIYLSALLILSAFLSLPAFSSEPVKSLKMATTTSTHGTGLLDYLIPEFTKQTGIKLEWIPTGTGKALKHGQNCDVDVLLVHAPPAEAAFIKNGYGKDRRQIMYNDFVIIGPAADPAGVQGKKVADALSTIRAKKATFVSRGDDSGTHKKEKILWKNAGGMMPEKEAWYLQTGSGMQATIRVCQEKGGYTMTDRGSFIKYQATFKGQAPLQVLVEGDAILLNQYSVLTLNPENCPNAKYELAKQFSDWMASKEAQELIKNFRLLGKKLFIPNAE